MKNNHGITLIALIVTIIVLLILAGVSLSLVAGGNGILNKAEKAVVASNEASIREEVELLLAEWYADYYIDGTEIEGRTEITGSGATVSYSEGEVTYTKNGKTYIVQINNGSVAKVEEENEKNSQSYSSRHPEKHIPTGFTHKEGTVETGYVITDATNEFVWIPVASSSDYTKQLGEVNWSVKSGSTGGYDYATDLDNDVSLAVQGDILGVGNILGTNVTSTLSNQPEAEIVNSAGGFWVGRYEAGTPSDIERTDEIPDDSYWADKSIVVKAGVEPVRAITQNKLLEIANNWKKGNADASKGTVAFQSGLITGSQWDAMCNFIGWETCDSDCVSWGNYANSVGASYTGLHSNNGKSDWVKGESVSKSENTNLWIFPTGRFVNSSNATTVKKNIYDVAGNAWEWTTEVPQSGASGAVIRGCSCGDDSSNHFVTFRHGSLSSTTSTRWYIGFRIVLYVE